MCTAWQGEFLSKHYSIEMLFLFYFIFFFMHRLCVHGKLELRSVVLGLTASANETSRVSYLDERVMSR